MITNCQTSPRLNVINITIQLLYKNLLVRSFLLIKWQAWIPAFPRYVNFKQSGHPDYWYYEEDTFY